MTIQFPWLAMAISVAIRGYPWMSMDIPGYLVIELAIRGYRVLVIHEYPGYPVYQ